MPREERPAGWAEREPSFGESAPIFRQIADLLCKAIASGEIAAGQQLPSVRDLALKYRVNPNTVQRAYQELEQEGVVEVRRGQGTFAVGDRAAVEELRRRLAGQIVRHFLREMRALGYASGEALALASEFREEAWK